MDTPRLLKEEINKTLEDLHDFAKWKLIVASALATAGFGLSTTSSQNIPYWLLVFVPYACAYIDLNCYQYLLRIFLINTVLCNSQHDSLLRAYEEQCEIYRRRGFFGFGIFAQLGSSLGFSLILPAFSLAGFILDHAPVWKLTGVIVVWLIGLLLLVLCYLSFDRKKKLLNDTNGPIKESPRTLKESRGRSEKSKPVPV